MHWSQARTSSETVGRFDTLADRLGGPAQAAQAWTAAGFGDEDTARWLEARCFDPEAARALSDLGVTPRQAAQRTRDGRDGSIDTIGYKVACGALSARQGAARAASSR